MTASAADAVSRARDLTQRRLFPIRRDEWLRLGFIAFLAGLGGGGSQLSAQLPGLPPGKSSTSLDFHDVIRQGEEFVRDNPSLVLIGSGFVVLVGLAIGALVTWLSSRGELIFVESVIHNRTAVIEPWTRLRVPGWQLFKARFAVGLAVAALSLLLLVVGTVLAWPEFRALRYLPALLRFLPFIAGVMLIAIPASIFVAVLRDFLVPIMYLDGVGVWAAWRSFRAGILSSNFGPLVTFYVIKTVLGFGAAAIALLATCLTCCLAALPYVGTVLLLPIHVFFRAYSLSMLEQLGRPVFPLAEPPQPFKGWF